MSDLVEQFERQKLEFTVTEKKMALINEILLFSTTLPVWQQDAIRRLFLHGDLKPQDYDDLLYQTQEGNPSHILIQGERGDF